MLTDMGENELTAIMESLENLEDLKKAYDSGYKLKNNFRLYLPTSDDGEMFYYSHSNFSYNMLHILIGDTTVTNITGCNIREYFNISNELAEKLDGCALSMLEINIDKNIPIIQKEKIVTTLGSDIKDYLIECLYNESPDILDIKSESICCLTDKNKKIRILADEEMYCLYAMDIGNILKILKGEK
ncbi:MULTISPECIES: hypothetical protein [Clostridium]|jgi:hypothetical protein|uniref:hypothetical protein n=1 Tax=Clostridium TaxID=1485 RepID=UPI000E9BFB90|nr:hypothetical protein [Clostridium tyrobutyricum]HBF76918.1 hypothetical protein [Clostridiaceae bacterium]